jgi:hypothetical protein
MQLPVNKRHLINALGSTSFGYLSGAILKLAQIVWWTLRETPSADQGDKIGILGRGSSLTEAGCLSFVDDFIIVNQFDEELQSEPIHSLLQNKNLIHLVNATRPVLHPGLLFRYRVDYCLVHESDRNIWKPGNVAAIGLDQREIGDQTKAQFKSDLPTRITKQLDDSYFERVEQHDILSSYPGNTGLTGILYIVTELDKSEIYIAGIDFYEESYLTQDLTEKFNDTLYTSHKYAGQAMKLILTDIAKQAPEIQFHILTHSSYNPDVINISTYHSEEDFRARL